MIWIWVCQVGEKVGATTKCRDAWKIMNFSKKSNFRYSEWSKRGHGLACGYSQHILSSGGHFPWYSMILFHFSKVENADFAQRSAPKNPWRAPELIFFAKNGTNSSGCKKLRKSRSFMTFEACLHVRKIKYVVGGGSPRLSKVKLKCIELKELDEHSSY